MNSLSVTVVIEFENKRQEELGTFCMPVHFVCFKLDDFINKINFC